MERGLEIRANVLTPGQCHNILTSGQFLVRRSFTRVHYFGLGRLAPLAPCPLQTHQDGRPAYTQCRGSTVVATDCAVCRRSLQLGLEWKRLSGGALAREVGSVLKSRQKSSCYGPKGSTLDFSLQPSQLETRRRPAEGGRSIRFFSLLLPCKPYSPLTQLSSAHLMRWYRSREEPLQTDASTDRASDRQWARRSW